MPSAFRVLGCRRAMNRSQGSLVVKCTSEELLPKMTREVASSLLILHESSPG